MTTSPVCFSLPTLIYQAIFLLVLSNSRGSVASLPEQHAAMHSTPDVVPQGDGVQGADLPGHLKPLGSHRPPEDPGIDVLHRVPDPLDFFNRYVKDGSPVIFKGAAQNMDSYKLWTDEYLSKSYGHLKVEVEEGKKENRSKDLWHMSLSNFIQKYQKEDVYLVTDVPPEMSDEFCLLRCLLCGGFPTSLVDTILWYSSGGTKSVLHFDGVDNINCIMDGSKEVFLVDKREQANINIDHPEQSFSGVDVDKVDLTKYPGLGQVPWYNVTMERGDCLFIPYRWFHAVRSWGRNLAVNVWFIHRLWFNETDCSDELMALPEYVPLSSFKTRASHLEILRSEIANGIEVYGGLITVEEMYDLIQRSTKQQITQLFQSLDQNGDKKLSMKEAYSESFAEACKSADISFDKEKDDEEEVEEGDEEEEEDDIGGEVENDEAHRSTGREEEHEEL
ncbi:bifunctional peptidase and arginyl-hydroxylase JMJD5 [Strongylocentrotus purpuratus]|uniref:JmjC domain-containing protein n=1 Tax=Strongylocentrotus purpuratus TaxID=7668 RepID=A0A7M7N9Q0_STRPU|nr:bifunctional peptidase and arginyl-hydroxylase JMJD5 [Strongylocentrotus purpuratus]XP_030832562.1 bifunctional peptidase and arginyl-hydroxylase JMJD5 [Strongylocentrotus purpuratus]